MASKVAVDPYSCWYFACDLKILQDLWIITYSYVEISLSKIVANYVDSSGSRELPPLCHY